MPLEYADAVAGLAGSGIAEALRKIDPKNPEPKWRRLVNVAAGVCVAAYGSQLVWSFWPQFLQFQEGTIFACGFCGSAVLAYASTVVNDPGQLRELIVGITTRVLGKGKQS